jgi:hypothetical protein
MGHGGPLFPISLREAPSSYGCLAAALTLSPTVLVSNQMKRLVVVTSTGIQCRHLICSNTFTKLIKPKILGTWQEKYWVIMI